MPFVSKKRLAEMEKRIAALEDASQVNTWSFGKVDLQKLAQIVEKMSKAQKSC